MWLWCCLLTTGTLIRVIRRRPAFPLCLAKPLTAAWRRDRSEGSRVAHEVCYCDSMAIEFRNQGTEDVFNGVNSKAARKICPTNLFDRAREKLFLIDDAETLEDLRVPPGNRLEALKGDRKGEHSIRINQQYRICFRWSETGARDVEITDYHP